MSSFDDWRRYRDQQDRDSDRDRVDAGRRLQEEQRFTSAQQTRDYHADAQRVIDREKDSAEQRRLIYYQARVFGRRPEGYVSTAAVVGIIIGWLFTARGFVPNAIRILILFGIVFPALGCLLENNLPSTATSVSVPVSAPILSSPKSDDYDGGK